MEEAQNPMEAPVVENPDEDIADWAIGVTVVYLQSVYRDGQNLKHHSPMDYHLHILIYRNPYGFIGAVCLDTSDMIVSPSKDEREISRKLSIELAKTFVNRVNSAMAAQRFEEAVIFDRAEPQMWDAFNRIKAQSYIKALKPFSEYTKSKSFHLAENLADLAPQEIEPYEWSNIQLSEERFLRT